MNAKKKFLSMLVVSLCLLGTLNFVYISEVKAVDYEIPIDYDFIKDVSDELSSVCRIPGRWQGREFGSQGESDAADILIELWEQNIGTAPAYPIDDEYIDAGIEVLWDAFDDKLEIESESDFELKINGNTILNDEYYPIPCLALRYRNLQNEEYEVIKTPSDWYDEYCDINEEPEGNELPDSMHFEIDYISLNGASGVEGDLCYIEDYSGTPLEGDTGIHLIEIEQEANDDVFTEKVNTVVDNGGSGFIIMTTNPSFIDLEVTDLPGVAISRYDGERLKRCLDDYDEVYLSMSDKLVVDCIINELGNYIYLIDYEEIRQREIGEVVFPYEDDGRMFKIVKYVFSKSQARTGDGDLPTMDAFLFCDLHNEDYDEPTYRECVGAMPSPAPRRFPKSPLFSSFKRPGFCISGERGSTITAEDTVEVTLRSSVNRSVESRNIIGTIPGSPGYENDVVIICGHYDSYRGQCASDDSLGPAIAWGIAKYYKDNNLEPKYTIKCIAWGGEEYGCLGSNFYVWKHVIDRLFREHIVAVINLDVLAMDTLEIPFTPWIWGKVGAVPYQIIEEALQKETYEENTPFIMELPSEYNLYNRKNNVSPSTDAESFKPYGLLNWPVADNIVCLERWMYEDSDIYDDIWPGDLFADWGEHRSGPGYNYGDVSEKISIVDMRETANITLRLSKLFAKESTVEFEDNSLDFSLQDLDQDTYYDSVDVSFNVTTEMTCWGTIEAGIYKAGVAQTKNLVEEIEHIIQDEVNPGMLTITLPPNATAGNCEVRISLKDYLGNVDDFGNETLYLYPYSNPIADFIWEPNENNKKMINFTDGSLPSPDATLVSWNWSFGDGNYSEEQNCSHNYSSVDTFNITLIITDSANKTANMTIQVKTLNTPPVADFITESDIVITNTSMTFSSHASDIDGSIVNTTWYFGDNSKGYGEEVHHEYTKSGFYSVSLVVTDNDNQTNYLEIPDCVLVVDALVDDDFRDDPDAHEWDTITEGLNDVENGGVIYVFNGSYASIEITKSVSLYGESRENVQINSGNPGVKIRYYNVTVDGFNVSSGTIRMDVNVKSDENHSSNVTINNCNIYGSSTIGILLNQSSFCVIENCTIQGNTYGVKIMNDSQYNVIRKCMISQGTYGVYVSDSSYNFIGSPSIINPYPTDCLFTDTLYGVKLVDSDHNFILGCDFDGTPALSGLYSETTKGIYLDNSENNTISTCVIHGMTDKGMYLVDSTWNKIEHCKISWNPIGITFDNSPENLITQNHFGGNSEFAVYMPTDTQFNHVYYNDFFVNGNGTINQTWDANGAKGAENLWNKDGNRTLTKTGDGEGNYWSDYTGLDDDEDGIGDTPYEINSSGILRNDSYPVMNPYGWCNFTQDSTLPVITNVSATPHTVGFGYNVTIQAVVTDNVSNISLVKVEVTYPDESIGNYTMECTGDSLYEYVFTDTWLTGQYNLSVWAMDESYNSNSSSGYHFHVSAQATMSIATLKNSYSGTQYINITDPPNPPENYTLVDRGLTWNTYYNATSGENILESYQGPVNYQEDNGTWTPINNTVTQLSSNHPAYVYGYRQGNDRGLFGVYFKSNAQQEWPIAFTYNKSDDPTIHAVRTKLVGVGYVDPQSNWAYQYLQNVQNSQGQTNDYSITYPGVFTGTDVTWSYGNTGLKEEITLSNATKTVLQNHPPSQYGLNDASSYLVFITKLDYQNLNIYNDSGMLDGNVTISENGVEFRDLLGQFKCALPLDEAYELNNETARQKLTYRIIHLNGNTYLLSGLKVADLNAMTFPVVIDPTLTVYSLSSDGYIYNYGSSYSTVQSASSGTVDSSSSYLTIGQKKVALGPTYYVYRGFVFFNTSALPSNAYLDNATLSLYKKDDYSTTDFDITIQNGQPTYPHNPMQTGDYFRNYYSGNGGTLGTSRFTSGYNAITMSNLNWINKTGITKLCLRSSKDISGTAPTGNEYVNVYTNEFLGMNPPKLVINYQNQSKIKNTGSTDIKGYLLVQVQFYNSTQGKWLVDNDTINETTARTITSGNQLALDTIFNGHIRASDLTHGTGTYRVYTAFRDPEGNILRTNDDVDLEAWWQFSKT